MRTGTSARTLFWATLTPSTAKQYFNEGKLAPADQSLRKSLPLVEGNAPLKTEVLFYLGLANYKMEKAQEAYTLLQGLRRHRESFSGAGE